MTNHVDIRPTIVTRMHVEGNYVITEVVIRDKRPIRYFTRDLLELGQVRRRRRRR